MGFRWNSRLFTAPLGFLSPRADFSGLLKYWTTERRCPTMRGRAREVELHFKTIIRVHQWMSFLKGTGCWNLCGFTFLKQAEKSPT